MNDEKTINVPLKWYEIDQIVVALRLVNKTFKGNMHDELEEKMSNYSGYVKESVRSDTIKK